MADDGFNPDDYLGSTADEDLPPFSADSKPPATPASAPAQGTFNPDAYLGQKAQPGGFNPDQYLSTEAGGSPTDILPAMGQEAAASWDTVQKGFGPSNEETYIKEASEAPFWDMTPTLRYYKRLGQALLTSVGSPFQAAGMVGAAGLAGGERYLGGGGYDPDKMLAALRAGKSKDEAFAEAQETPAQTYQRWRKNVDLAMLAIPSPKVSTAPKVATPPVAPQPGPFGVTLSSGEATGDLAARIREQEFLRQATSPHAQAWREQRVAQLGQAPAQAAEKFDPFGQTIVDSSQEASDVVSNALTRQQRDIDNLVQNSEQNLGAQHEAFRESLNPGHAPVQSPMEASNIISGAVANEEARAQEAIDQAYGELRDLPGQFHPAAFNKVGDKMRARLADDIDLGAINPQTTPQTDSSLNYLDDVLSGVKQRRDPDTGQILPKPPITADVVETARKRLNSFYGSALQAARSTNNWSDVNAMRKVMNLFDSQVADRLKKGTFTGGDPTAVIDTMENARQIYSNYRKTFTPQGSGDAVGRDIQTILGRGEGMAATPEQVSGMLYGTGPRPVRIIQRLKQMFGPDSPEVGVARQGFYSYVTERPPGAAAWGPEKVADRIDQFTEGAGKTLTEEYLSPPQIADLKQFSQQLRSHANGVDLAKNPFEGVNFQGEFRKAIAGNQDSMDLLNQAFDRLGGHSSPFGVALKQGLFQHAIQPTENVAVWGPKKVGDNLYRLLASTRNSPIYSPADRGVIESYAKLMRQIEMPKDTYAPSSPAINRALSVVGYRIGQLIGAMVGRHVPFVPPIVGEFAGITIGGKLERALEATRINKVKSQLPLVSEQIARYQKAMNAYNRAQNPGTQRIVGIAATNLTTSLRNLGIDSSYLQLPGLSPAGEEGKKKNRASGGAVNRDDGGGIQYTQPFPEAPGGYPFLTTDPTSTQLEPAGGDQPADVPVDVATPTEPVDQLVSPEHRSIVDKLFGITGPRYQTWPERMIRSGFTAPGEAYQTGQLQQRDEYGNVVGAEPVFNPETGYPSETAILRAQDIAGMAGGTSFGAAEEGAVGMAGGKLPSGWKTVQGGAEAGAGPTPQQLIQYAGITPESWMQMRPVDRDLITRGYELHQQVSTPPPVEIPRQMTLHQIPTPEEVMRSGQRFNMPDPSKLTIQRSRTFGNEGEPSGEMFFVNQPSNILPESEFYGMPQYKGTDVVTGFHTRKEAEDFIRAAQQKQQRPADWSGPSLYSESGRAGAPLSALEKPFYSAVERAVQNAPQNKMQGSQWLGWLKNQPGVKQEELDWMGLPDMLSGNNPIAKADLLEHVQGHGVGLQEVEKGSPDLETLTQRLANEVEDQFYQQKNRNPDEDEREKIFEEARRAVKRDPESYYDLIPDSEPTKYHEYQLPGGSNYREMLLRLPEAWETHPMSPQERDYLRLLDNKIEKGEVLGPEEKAQHTRLDKLASIRDNAPEPFTTSHWDEPNVLMHLRMNDRYIPDKAGQHFQTEEGGALKSLHLEELQSDWHQQGRKKGYDVTTGPTLKELDKIATDKKGELIDSIAKAQPQLSLRSVEEMADSFLEHVRKGEHDRFFSPEEHELAKQQIEAANRYWSAREKGSGVPNAPFKTTWPELGLKRAIAKAAKEGYDAISWTPGEQQAARYDLSKHVDEIHYDAEANRLAYKNKGADTWNEVDNVTKDKLGNYIGKDAAEKILNTHPSDGIHRLQGVDLKVGGEGMRAFYDKMLVDKANAIGKKYGAKVEWKPLGHDFMYGPDELKIEPVSGPGARFKLVDPTGRTVGTYVTRAEAERDLSSMAKEFESNVPKVPVLKLTPELKKAASSGMPLFSESGKAGAPLSALENSPKSLGEFIKNPSQGVTNLRVYRTGKLQDAGRGLFFGDSPESVGPYQSLHNNAPIKAYDVDANKVKVVESPFALHKELFGGKSFQDAVWEADKKSGFKSSVEASRRVEASMANALKRKGYDALVYTKPPAPAKHEIAVFDSKVVKEVKQNKVPREPTEVPNESEDGQVRQRAAGGRVDPDNINHKPTEHQKEAGNYAKDHVNIHGLSIAIENAKGSQRSGIGADGKPWKSTLPAHYGYVKRTEGADGDHVDVYLGPHLKSNKVFIIDQVDHKSKRFDEHKIMLGFGSKYQALDIYKKAFSDSKGKDRIGAVHEMNVAALKAWLQDGHTTEPIHKALKGRKADERIKRDAFLYMEPKGNGKAFAQCSECIKFNRGTKNCTIMDKIVAGGDSCGMFIEGPFDGSKPAKLVTPQEIGYVQRQVRCENCKYGGVECWLYKMLNQRQPEDFDLETKIHPKGCCNANTPKGE